MKPNDCPVPYYGGDYCGPCPLERVEQISFINRIRQDYPDTWGLLATHIRNEDGSANARQVKKMKLEGMVAGTADILIMGNPPMALEMKRLDPTKSTLSDDQAAYLVAAQAAGAFACIAFGAVAAWEAFQHWLTLQPEGELF